MSVFPLSLCLLLIATLSACSTPSPNAPSDHHPWIAEQWSLDIDPISLDADTRHLILTIPGQGRLEASRIAAHTRPDGTLSWHGSLSAEDSAPAQQGTRKAAMNNVLLVRAGNRIAGVIRHEDRLYRLLPQGDSQVLTRIDPARLPAEHDPLSPSGANSIRNPRPQAPAREPGHATIRVLVLGTRDAAETGEDLPLLARLAIEESNQTYANSGIELSLELTDYVQTDYTQSGLRDLDLVRLMNVSDGYMDDIHPLRDAQQADVVVLLRNLADSTCGRAAEIGASAETAFALVTLQCIGVGRMSFAHEIGHLQGAAHDMAPPGTSPFPYGHGYIHQPQGQPAWRTIMATLTEQETTRLPYWSDPDLILDGVPMGDPETADNQRVLEETKWTVAGFR